MLYTPLTNKALRLCFEAHKNQVDKGGIPYVFHPFHLAEQMETEEEICVALLHDVVEDTDRTLDQIAAEGFPPCVVEALTLLTHKDGTPYLDYVKNLKSNPLAAKVKLADLRHNSTPGRMQGTAIPEPASVCAITPEQKESLSGYDAAIHALPEKDLSRMRKYLRAQAILMDGEADHENMRLYVNNEEHRICFLPDGRILEDHDL